LGWLLVLFLFCRGVSLRIERGKPRAWQYFTTCWPALPGFALEWFSDSGLHKALREERGDSLIQFAAYSSAFLIYLAMITAAFRFGLGIEQISHKDEHIWRASIWIGASSAAISTCLGAVYILMKDLSGSARVELLESWFYVTSLLLCFILLTKMMLPLLIRRFRLVLDRRTTRH
jgi:hypothetical protein